MSDGLGEEDAEEDALADDEGVDVGVTWGLRVLDLVAGGERVGEDVPDTAFEALDVPVAVCEREMALPVCVELTVGVGEGGTDASR